MLKPKQMRTLERAVADAGRADLADLMRRIRVARKAEFDAHIRRLVYEIKTSRRVRRARISEIRAEVRDSREEWQRQARRSQAAKTEQL